MSGVINNLKRTLQPIRLADVRGEDLPAVTLNKAMNDYAKVVVKSLRDDPKAMKEIYNPQSGFAAFVNATDAYHRDEIPTCQGHLELLVKSLMRKPKEEQN